MHDLQVQRQGPRYFIRPADTPSAAITDDLFDPSALAARGRIEGEARGRASAWFIRVDGRPLVLRHYCRGGLPARISRDRYVWRGLQATRAWREMALLTALQRLALPAPHPVGARVVRHGLTWTADIVMDRIENAETLADLAAQAEDLEALPWRAVGQTIRQFHAEGVGHADLNIRNILVDTTNAVWLIDWDRGQLNASPRFQARSLVRLQRSIDKEAALRPIAATGFAALMDGYREAS